MLLSLWYGGYNRTYIVKGRSQGYPSGHNCVLCIYDINADGLAEVSFKRRCSDCAAAWVGHACPTRVRARIRTVEQQINLLAHKFYNELCDSEEDEGYSETCTKKH